MSEQYSPQLHTDTLRLRLLLTNGCNQTCTHCLNEYQQKPVGEPRYLCTESFEKVTIAYETMLGNIEQDYGQLKRRVYLSGGEPTLHPHFSDFVSFLNHNLECELTLCTNGNNWAKLIQRNVYNKIDHLHFSFGFLSGRKAVHYFEEILDNLENWKKNHDKKNIVVSMVTKEGHAFEESLEAMRDFRRSTGNGFTLKLWGDLRYNKDHPVNQQYARLLTRYPELIHRGPVTHPVNRGIGCSGCNRACPTLKAIWVRANGTVSLCPQGNVWDDINNFNVTSLEEKLLQFYRLHFETIPCETNSETIKEMNMSNTTDATINDCRGCYSDIIENLPGILHRGDNMLVVLSSGPRMVNYLGDRALCISGISAEEQATLFETIERETEFRVTNWMDGLGIYVPEHCTDIGAVAAISDAGRQLLSDIKKI